MLHALKKSDAGFNEFGEVYFSCIENNGIKAWKCHQRMTLNLGVPIGKVNFVFHSTKDHSKLIKNTLLNENFKNCDVVSDELIKSHILKKSIFAVAKSGTVSLEICNAKVPSIIIYKMNKINFFIIKKLVKVKSPNIINIAANEEVIPELLQSKCNPNDIFKTVVKLFEDKNSMDRQVIKSQKIISDFKRDGSAKTASLILLNYL